MQDSLAVISVAIIFSRQHCYHNLLFRKDEETLVAVAFGGDDALSIRQVADPPQVAESPHSPGAPLANVFNDAGRRAFGPLLGDDLAAVPAAIVQEDGAHLGQIPRCQPEARHGRWVVGSLGAMAVPFEALDSQRFEEMGPAVFVQALAGKIVDDCCDDLYEATAVIPGVPGGGGTTAALKRTERDPPLHRAGSRRSPGPYRAQSSRCIEDRQSWSTHDAA